MPPASPDRSDELPPDLGGLGLRTEFQPIVELRTRTVVGYEALSRGAKGSPLERPDRLIATARAAGRLIELDCLLRGVAFSTATEGGLRAPGTLFVNCEPETARSLGRLDEIWARGAIPFESVTEITERALSDDPARLVASVNELRALGWGIALDDMGLDDHAMALLPFVQPDVVKLDLRLVQAEPSRDLARAVSAVNGYADRTGAAVLAEGIETEQHLAAALALGASFGQGYLFGRPGPLPAEPPVTEVRVPNLPPPAVAGALTPFALLGAHRAPRRGPAELLDAIAGHIEVQAGALGKSAIVLSRLDGSAALRDERLRGLGRVAETAGFVGVVGRDMPDVPVDGVHGGSVDGDGAPAEWALTILDGTHAAALVARESADGGGGNGEPGYEFVLTHDRALVIDVARSLMAHVAPTAT